MLAIFLLIASTAFADIVCRRLFRFTSFPHRIACAFLTGIVITSCLFYLLALGFAGTSSPLLWANLIGFALLGGLSYFIVKRFPPIDDVLSGIGASNTRPPGDWRWDLVILAICTIFGCWLMIATLTYDDGYISFSTGSMSDFGANISLAQSLAFGNNYPTEHPFLPGETIRYHFMLWFLSGNLQYLGLNIVWSVTLLSMLSLLALLMMVMTFAEQLFHSRAVARISVIFIFLTSSSLSYLPFLYSYDSFTSALNAIMVKRAPLVSGFPYRGEGWGGLSIITFINQRQLIATCGIALIVLTYLVGFYRRRGVFPLPEKFKSLGPFPPPLERSEAMSLVFCGLLIGMLPYWNTAVLLAIAAVIGGMLLLFPFRRYLLILILTATVIGLPQLILLSTGNVNPTSHKLLSWGYTVVEPSATKVVEYLGWTFGFKWLLLAIAFFFTKSAHRRLLIALFMPVVVAFSFHLSVDIYNNHKLLNVWGALTAVYLAYAIWLVGRRGIVRKVLAVALILLVTTGAIIDLFSIHTDIYMRTAYGNDRLTKWVLEETQPSDVFLTPMYLHHSILMAGRKIYYGNTLYAWGAGYNLGERDSSWKKMFSTNNPPELIELLRQNNIAYIATDYNSRQNENTKHLNETMLQSNFQLVYDDTENKHSQMKIYRVP